MSTTHPRWAWRRSIRGPRARRCGGFGDFIDVEIDDEGRPWIALAHNTAGSDEAIIGTFTEGPSLYGDLAYMEALPAGGPSTLKL